ncbi:FUSC family protein [Francisella sp. LA112445]|uniref:FUSC family protein n=1 Tax=Francisella sp. LA112445 TaxID=1395624 RepID=UPI001788A7FD|nr:FUSC family protein [Francisella sp. LA112445]
MFGLFKELFYIEYSNLYLKIAAVATLTCIFSLFICLFLHVKYPYWGAVTVFAILSPNLNMILYKAPRRVLGTIIGSVVAILIVLIFSSYPLLTLIVLILLGAIGFYVSKVIAENYFTLFITVHILFIGVGILFDPNIGFSIAEYRLISNCIAIVCTCVVFSFVYKLARGAEFTPTKSSKEDAFLYSAILTVSIVIAIIVWETLKIPGGSLNMVICLITIAGINNSGSLLKGKQRFYGCILGVCSGVITIFLSSVSIVIFFISFFCFATFFIYYSLAHKSYQYTGLQAAVAICITCFPNDSMRMVIEDGLYRALGIMLGVIIINIVFMVFRYVFNKP